MQANFKGIINLLANSFQLLHLCPRYHNPIRFNCLSTNSSINIEDNAVHTDDIFHIPKQEPIQNEENNDPNITKLDEDEEHKTFEGFERSSDAEYGHFKIGMVIFPEYIRAQLRCNLKANPYKNLFLKDIARINSIAQAAHQILPPVLELNDNRIKAPSSGRKANGNKFIYLFKFVS